MKPVTIAKYTLILLALWIIITGIGTKSELSDMNTVVYDSCTKANKSHTSVYCQCIADQLVKRMFVSEWIARITVNALVDAERAEGKAMENASYAAYSCAEHE